MAGTRTVREPRIRMERVRAQLLAGPPARATVDVARRLLAVQAQNLRSARLAVRARSRGLTAADVDRALGHDRSVVISWLCRGTLHLVDREDYPWLLALAAPTQLTGNARRLQQMGFAPARADRALGEIERILADGPATRSVLAHRLAGRGIDAEGQALAHLLFLASLRGITIRGPFAGGEQAFVLARDWLGVGLPTPLAGDARDRSLAELARRYLRGHGPAAAADLAVWAGLPLRDARTGLRAIARELEHVGGDLVGLSIESPRRTPVPPRLLPSFDPYLLGWKDRSFATTAEHAGRARGGGIIRAVATVRGVAVATWTAPRLRGLRSCRVLAAFGEFSKPVLDQVQPRAGGRCVVQVPAALAGPGEPVFDDRCFVHRRLRRCRPCTPARDRGRLDQGAGTGGPPGRRTAPARPQTSNQIPAHRPPPCGTALGPGTAGGGHPNSHPPGGGPTPPSHRTGPGTGGSGVSHQPSHMRLHQPSHP